MAHRGGRGGRMANMEEVYEQEEAARFVQLEEYKLAPWLENRFEVLKQKLAHQIASFTAANQLRNQSPNPPPNLPIVEEENDGDFNNPFAEYEAGGWSFVNNLDPRRWESRLPINDNCFVDWSLPPIFDDYPEESYSDDESMGGNNFEFEEKSYTNSFIEFGEDRFVRLVDLVFPPKFDEEITLKKSEVKYYDFIGIEQILSGFCVKKMISTYLKIIVMKSRLLNLAWRMDMWKIEDFKYSKYLIIWGGRLQYLCNEDHANSRPNSLQQGENDAIWKFIKEKLLVVVM